MRLIFLYDPLRLVKGSNKNNRIPYRGLNYVKSISNAGHGFYESPGVLPKIYLNCFVVSSTVDSAEWYAD